MVFMGRCIGVVAGGSNTVNHDLTAKHTVVYTVSGVGTASSITYDTLTAAKRSGGPRFDQWPVPCQMSTPGNSKSSGSQPR